MESETINKENLATAPWEDDFFRCCDFEDFSMEGGQVTSDFISCSFRRLDWYWTIFNNMNFIGCEFADCVFRGASLSCRFVECTLNNCRFQKDNLDGDCKFDGSVAHGCTVVGGRGFLIASVSHWRHTNTVFPTPDSSA
jgi:uncharacterized protein YjbI with pentapeptide repeats